MACKCFAPNIVYEAKSLMKPTMHVNNVLVLETSNNSMRSALNFQSVTGL